jgi:hypothetical protein
MYDVEQTHGLRHEPFDRSWCFVFSDQKLDPRIRRIRHRLSDFRHAVGSTTAVIVVRSLE